MNPPPYAGTLIPEAMRNHANVATNAGHMVGSGFRLSEASLTMQAEGFRLSFELSPCTKYAMLRSLNPLVWNL